MSKEERLKDGLLRISEIAEKAGVLSSTIRHYTDMGLLKVNSCTDGGHRLYEEKETLSRLSKIGILSHRGYTLPQIKAELEGKRRKLLIVDDEQESVDFIRELLSDRFVGEIETAMDGFMAGRLLSTFLPDLVILDLMLPGMDGFAVCRQIRKDNELADTRVLAITGYDTPDNIAKIFEAGADAYLAKPMDADELIKKINDLLGVTMKTISEQKSSA